MKTFATLLATACLLIFANAARAIIVDGSFELAEPTTTNSNSAWTLVESAPDGLGASFEPFAASDGELGVWFRPFDGTDGEPASAQLSQTIPNVAGGNYFLHFDAARELNFTATSFTATFSSSGGQSNNIDLNTAVMNLPSNMFANPTAFVIPLLGVAAGDDLAIVVEMTGGAQALNNPQSAFVDNFRIVPEPSGIALAIAGVAALAIVALRRVDRPSLRLDSALVRVPMGNAPVKVL